VLGRIRAVSSQRKKGGIDRREAIKGAVLCGGSLRITK
jgi:hypothetical protein